MTGLPHGGSLILSLKPSPRSRNTVMFVGVFWLAAVIVLVPGIASLVSRGSFGMLFALVPAFLLLVVGPVYLLSVAGVLVDSKFVYVKKGPTARKVVARSDVAHVLYRSGYGQLLDKNGAVLALVSGLLTKHQLQELATVLDCPYTVYHRN